MSCQAARPGGAGGGDGTAGAGCGGIGGGGKYGIARYHFRVIIALQAPLACRVCGQPFSTQPNLNKHLKWSQTCGGKVAPKRRASLISENDEGEKVTLVDVDEEVVFLKIEKQEDEKGNLGGRNGGVGPLGGMGIRRKR